MFHKGILKMTSIKNIIRSLAPTLPLRILSHIRCSFKPSEFKRNMFFLQTLSHHSLVLQRHVLTCRSSPEDTSQDALRAVEGDIVAIHWTCMNEEGSILESSRDKNEVATFEVGAGNFVGNKLFEAFDEAVRGMAIGESIGIKACH